MSNNVLISYSRQDIEFVKAIDTLLIEHGIKAWVDWRDIPAAKPWRQAIYDGLIASDVVLLFLSPTYVESENCRVESYLARQYGKRVVPIMVQNCFTMLSNYEETKGLEDIPLVNYFSHEVFGFPVTDDFLLNMILDVIHDKPRPWYRSDDLYYISYSARDALFAGQVASDLTQVGIDTFFTPLSCSPAIAWRESMSRAMIKAKALIVCISPSSAHSSWVRREVLFALTRRLPVFPIVTEDTSNSGELIEEMRNVLEKNYEMRLLADVNWLYPRPSYEHLRDSLIGLIRG